MEEMELLSAFCANCAYIAEMELADFIKYSLWPVTTLKTTFIEFALLHFGSTVWHFSPELSMNSTLGSLLFISLLPYSVNNHKPLSQFFFVVVDMA